MAALGVLMRWIHIFSMAVLLGGLVYARFVIAPSLRSMGAGIDRQRVSDTASAVVKPMLIAAIVGLLGSGIYNFTTKPFYPPGYQMWFGIKMLFAAHILAVAFLLAMRPMDAAKRDRLAAGVVFSGAAVLLISAWLRYLTLSAMVAR